MLVVDGSSNCGEINLSKHCFSVKRSFLEHLRIFSDQNVLQQKKKHQNAMGELLKIIIRHKCVVRVGKKSSRAERI